MISTFCEVIVINLPDLDLSPYICCKNRIDNSIGVGPVRNFSNNQCFLIQLADPLPLNVSYPHADHPLYLETSNKAAGKKIREQLEFLPCNIFIEASISSLNMREDFRGKAYCNALPRPVQEAGGTWPVMQGVLCFFHHRKTSRWWSWRLNSTSSANFDKRASIYLGAAALSPVRTFPQFPWASMSKSFWPNCTRASPMEASP